MTHFKIIVPFYNVEKWVLYNIRSVKMQQYKNFQCILVNDHSTDNTTDIIKKEIENDDKFSLYTNIKKTGALGSINYGIDKSDPNDEDIIIILDGDDWFANPEVLTYLKDVYEKEKCWITYGSYMEYPSGIRGKFSRQLPQEIIDKQLYRETEWMTSHLRTFKFKLWRRIKKEDMQNKEGNFYPMAADLPTVIPMLEMAGNRSHYIDKILHIYNRTNPSNEDKVNHQLQLSIEMEIRNKQKYKLLEDI
jgi:glycosyltransferase involved in cell wall biosynthesis